MISDSPNSSAAYPQESEAFGRLMRWVDIVTHPVQGYSGIANDEPVEVEASILYNLLHAKEAFERGE